MEEIDLTEKGWWPVLRTWIYSIRMARDVVWTVYRHADGRVAVLRATPDEEPDLFALRQRGWITWNDDKTGRAFPIEAAPFEALLAEGRDLPVAGLGFTEVGGFDGKSRGFAMSNGHNASSFRLEWWMEGPPEWRPFTLWVERLQRVLWLHTPESPWDGR